MRKPYAIHPILTRMARWRKNGEAEDCINAERKPSMINASKSTVSIININSHNLFFFILVNLINYFLYKFFVIL